MLLGELGGGVHVPRIHGRVLADQAGRQLAAAHGAGGLEASGGEILDVSRPGPHRPMGSACVPAFAVHHHRPGQHEPSYARLGHGGEQDGRTEVVAGDVLRGVGESGAEADHGRLVADGVHTGQGALDRRPVAHVRAGVLAHVEDDGLVPVCRQGLDDMGPDEPGTAGDQYAHALTLGPRAGRAAGPRPARHRSVRRTVVGTVMGTVMVGENLFWSGRWAHSPAR